MKALYILTLTTYLSWSSALAFDHEHKLWDQVLKKFVVDQGPSSVVKYRELKSSPKNLSSYLSELSVVNEKIYDTWTKEERLAFLINAYNAFTLKLIVDHYPVKSIRDISGLFSSPWKKEFFLFFGKETHLDHIEHDLIRGKFQEPRIHFALVCASIGCPKLSRDAFVAKSFEKQLEDAAKVFLQDKSRNRLGAKPAPELYLSSIFKWYGKDFGPDDSALKAVILPKMNLNSEEMKVALGASIKFLDYDWRLNDAASSQKAQ